ncbi:DUF7848 domain-containing protein [Streptomyces sp. H27-D2]|uniref:DUF7848 domain-containing protein n=1 Tax=Streptomyces sp. H27-D2 TaxID=3046304 RepID=UPI002DBADE43|nr:hypothetical protein [Streptomyces sp. H27-D2]MEC4021006.1 hypothetical protein [Streptomyces sp. H27-D2]
MTRSVYRYISWTMGPDPARKAPEMVHELQCTTCDLGSGEQEVFEKARDWAFKHIGGHPSHQSYREIVTRFWCMDSGEADDWGSDCSPY